LNVVSLFLRWVYRYGKSLGMSLVQYYIVVVMMEEFECGKVWFLNLKNKADFDESTLGTINGPWKCESNISLQSEALERAKADTSQSTEPVWLREKKRFQKSKIFIFRYQHKK
jgi:hypothetical protein